MNMKEFDAVLMQKLSITPYFMSEAERGSGMVGRERRGVE
jgi:hypothetical protein